MVFYQILDWFFIIFHTALIIFNVFGWAVKSLRKWNLITLSLTAVSWFILGIFYGMGYCFLTDWHWSILLELDKYPIENSYVQYLFRRLFSIKVTADFADTLTASVFFIAVFISVFLNIRDIILKKKSRSLLKNN